MRVHHVRDLGTRPNPTQMTAQMPAQNTPHNVVLSTRPNTPTLPELAVMRPNPLEGFTKWAYMFTHCHTIARCPRPDRSHP